MADFSSKKLSEVYESLLHLDNGSGTASKMSGATTNRVIRDGANESSTINITTDQVTLGKSNEDGSTPNDVALAVRQADGNAGPVFSNTLNVWNNNANEGGQINLKDGATAHFTGERAGFSIDNYVNPAGERSLRSFYTSALNITTNIMYQTIKDGEPMVGIGTSPSANLHVQGTLKISDTIYEKYDNQIYVDTTNGSDEDSGTIDNPYKTLHKAMHMISPSSYNTINLFGHTSVDKTYKWCSAILKGDCDIRVVKEDGSPIDHTVDSYSDYRDHTIIIQDLVSDYDGLTRSTAQVLVTGSKRLSISGCTFKVSFPGTNLPGHHKVPIRFWKSNGSINLGSFNNSSSDHNTEISFLATNSNSSNVADDDWCNLFVAEENSSVYINSLNTRWNETGPTSFHYIAGYLLNSYIRGTFVNNAILNTSFATLRLTPSNNHEYLELTDAQQQIIPTYT